MHAAPLSFLIISGTSGSGKTIALQVLEDQGYYSIDNLPASLLPELAQQAQANPQSAQRYAISIDSRNQDILADANSIFAQLDQLGTRHRIIFLDADDATLLKRYSETRRKHPLSDEQTSLAEAMVKERRLLEDISDNADYRLNTSRTTPHELRAAIRNYAAANEHKRMTVLFQSFGFKYGNPRDADFVFDVRCLPNPHWQAELKPLTGLDPPVQEFLLASDATERMYHHLRDFLTHWLPFYINENRNYMTVAIGCTGGQHRSVYISERLCNHFKNDQTIVTQVRHRELGTV